MSTTDGVSILLVEDELLLRMVMSEELRDAGYQVTDVANAEDAIAALPQGFDVLVTDIRMPGKLNGWDIAEAVRARNPECLIIYMSGYTGGGVRQLPHTHFLSKPCTVSQIVNLLKAGPPVAANQNM
jgi:CheY-like chemotaxis protein